MRKIAIIFALTHIGLVVILNEFSEMIFGALFRESMCLRVKSRIYGIELEILHEKNILKEFAGKTFVLR